MSDKIQNVKDALDSLDRLLTPAFLPDGSIGRLRLNQMKEAVDALDDADTKQVPWTSELPGITEGYYWRQREPAGAIDMIAVFYSSDNLAPRFMKFGLSGTAGYVSDLRCKGYRFAKIEIPASDN